MTLGEFRERLQVLSSRARMPIAAALIEPLYAYFRLLAHWNSRINLTSLRLDSPSDEALERLFLEPLAAAKHTPAVPAWWLDIGSGGGSPAIPLKVARPGLRLTMVESRSRKAAFLREVVRELDLADADVFCGRFDDLAANPEGQHAANLLTTRAVRTDSSFFIAASLMLRPSGELLVFRSAAEPVINSNQFDLGKPTVLGNSGQTRLDHYRHRSMFHVEQSS